MAKIATLKRVVTSFTIASFGLAATAVPARPGLNLYTQADGTTVQVRLVGDENGHYYLSEDGYLLINKSGNFYYGVPDSRGIPQASSLRAHDIAGRDRAETDFLSRLDRTALEGMARENMLRSPMRRVRPDRQEQPSRAVTRDGEGYPKGPGLFPGASFPSIGKQKAIVILVEYSDVKFITDNPSDYFYRMLNEEGFSDLGGTGSARDFFVECSGGLFEPEFDLYGPVTLSQPMIYYGRNDAYGVDEYAHKMAIEACQQLDDTVDFTQYDRDGDGVIDNVYIFYAGRGEGTGGSPETVWQHSWDLSIAEPDNLYMFDGVRLDRYACSNEWDVYKGVERPDAVGVFVHEFSHVLGLPDLYSTESTKGIFSPGSWSTLDYGPYNNNNCTPPLYGAFERYALGWMAPEVIDGPANISLEAIGSNKACIIPTDRENEFFLLENRQQTGWDTYIPGHGMLIWHIDYSPMLWDLNTVNNNASRQHVDIEEADNIRNEDTRAGDAFPGTAGVTSFTDETSPSSKTWNGKNLRLPITEITETPEGLITFLVDGGFTLPGKTVATAPHRVGHDWIEAAWEEAAHASGYRLYVEEAGSDTPLPDWDGYDAGNTLSAVVTGLRPETAYSYRVVAYNRCGDGEASDEVAVTTVPFTFDLVVPEALEVTVSDKNSFEASWMPVEGASSYLLNVYTKTLGEPYTDGCNFDGGTTADLLPNGWTASSEVSFAMGSYAGESIPALRLGNDGDWIQTPEYDDIIHSLSFWTRGSGTSEDASISVMAYCDGVWKETSRVPAGKSLNARTLDFDFGDRHVYAVRLVFNRAEAGSLSIDDIVVKYGGDKYPVWLDGMERKDVGDVTSYKVDGLNPGTEYFFTVNASDGTLVSRESNEVAVTTAADSGVAAVAATTFYATVSGDDILLSAPGYSEARIYDTTGRLLGVSPVSDGLARFSHLPTGLYIIAADGGKVVKVIK